VSFDGAKPSNSLFSIAINNLKCNVEIGTFVVINLPTQENDVNDCDDTEVIGRIVDIAHVLTQIDDEFQETAVPQDNSFPLVKVNLFQKLTEEKYEAIHHSRVNDSLCRHVPEVAQTLDYVWIPADQLKHIAFVFHLQKIIDGTFPCQGMKFAYSIRFQVGEDMEATLIPHATTVDAGMAVGDGAVDGNEWEPFPCGLFKGSIAESYMSYARS
jgi:hypothetical protein